MNFDIYKLIKDLSDRRKVFVSEADFQLELAWLIKEQYPDAKVRLEYCPEFNPDIHIDILVVMDGKWIPVELKYKTRKSDIYFDGERYLLKDHSAKDVNSYAYLKDIKRIETVRDNCPLSFREGYAVMLTNDMSYLKKPRSENVNYYAFSIHQENEKTGILDWGEKTGIGTKGKEYKDPIELKGNYKMNWADYSRIDGEEPSSRSTKCFKVLINKIENDYMVK